MDYVQAFILSSSALLLIILWKVGMFGRLWEAVQYIQLNGWTEYRAARKRYDEHIKQEKQKVTKRDKIEAIKARRMVKK